MVDGLVILLYSGSACGAFYGSCFLSNRPLALSGLYFKVYLDLVCGCTMGLVIPIPGLVATKQGLHSVLRFFTMVNIPRAIRIRLM